LPTLTDLDICVHGGFLEKGSREGAGSSSGKFKSKAEEKRSLWRFNACGMVTDPSISKVWVIN